MSPSHLLGWRQAVELFHRPVEAGRTAGSLARSHRKSHTGIDDADYLIAATALVLEADLLTTNVRHFPMPPGLLSPY